MNRKLIIGGIIAVGTVALITVGILRSGSSPVFGGNSGLPVKVAEVNTGEISSYVSSDGVVEEAVKAEVYFDTPMKVNRALVKKGDAVKKGQKLLELDLDSLISQLETLKINKNTQEISLNSKALDAEVERAQSALKSAERNYDDTKKTYENNKALYEANAISKTELDMSEKAFIEADTGMSGLANARLNYENALESRKNGRQTATDNLKITNLQIDDLEKKLARVNADVLSPMDGVVAELNVQDGSFTGSMQPAYKVIDPEKLQVKASIKEYDIKNIAVGQNVRITGDAIDKTTEVTGKVTGIAPVAVTSMTTGGSETFIEVLIGVEGAGKILKPGLNVTCDISTVDRKGVLLIPMEAIIPDKDDNNLVYTVDTAKNTITRKTITLGLNSDMNVEVLSGLEAGELVILSPQPSFRDGDKVRIQETAKEK